MERNFASISEVLKPLLVTSRFHLAGLSTMNFRMLLATSSFLIVLSAASASNWTAAETVSTQVPRISIEKANQIHGNSDVIFIDVRKAKAWWRSTVKIARAIREEPSAIQQWAPNYDKSKTLILYCA